MIVRPMMMCCVNLWTNILKDLHSPWYSEELRAKKQELRRYERKWVKSGLLVEKQIFHKESVAYKTLLEKSKATYHRSPILDCDQSKLFKLVHQKIN